MNHYIDQWQNIQQDFRDIVLLGNGASIAVNPKFSYSSLIDYACENGLLPEDVKQLFVFFQTEDFELVLRLVWQASNVNRSLNIPDQKTHEAYLRVRNSLIQSVRSVHPEYQEIESQIPTIYNFLKNFKTVLSLNYDLIVYWAVTYGINIADSHALKDCFINATFDDNWQRFRWNYNGANSTTLVFYPHGSLILARNLVETEYKITISESNLLNAILANWESEICVPLFVSEGTVEQKIKSIHGSYYLSTVYREVLTDTYSNIVIYGWSFGEQDLHLLRRMVNSGINKVAISVYGNDLGYCNRVCQIVHEILGIHVTVSFFESNSSGCWNKHV